jgi:hypothetical protein
MGRALILCLALAVAAAGCRDDKVVVVVDAPAAPRALAVTYYAGSVSVDWELAPEWDGEAFRVYAKRTSDASFFFIAEVTSCIGGFCTYEDLNVLAGETYEYRVSAVNDGGETFSSTVSVFVPTFTPPPVPASPYVIALDNANYVTWDDNARGVADFSFYKVYLDDAGTTFLLGETDSEGFLDLLAGNGSTYSYFVTAIDDYGHESGGSLLAEGTPRPDYHGEWIYAFEDQPTLSGFRFQADEGTNPILSGSDATRDFRLESDGVQWWLVPGPNADVNLTSWATTALKCGVAADATCTDRTVAPTTNYTPGAVELFASTTYVIRTDEGGGNFNYGAIRVEFLGFDGSDAIMIFDWAFQLQSNNPNLVQPAEN